MTARNQHVGRTGRVLALVGASPLVLMGCVAHDAPPPAFATPPAYHVAVPVPPPPPPPPAAPVALRQAVGAMGQAFVGKVGIAIRSVDDGWTVQHDGNLRMPQQSVSKLWVAMTVLDHRDAGRLSLDDDITVRREDLTLFHQPIAALVKGEGYQTTVRDLLRRALTLSDNTANDRLVQLVGGPGAVREFIARRGLGNIRFGPGERLLQAKTAGLTWQQGYSLGNAFTLARSKLPQSVRLAAFNAYVADPPDGAAAGAIADALVRLKDGDLLSPESTRWLIDTMSDTKTGRARLKAALPPGWGVAHKTGTGQDLLGRTAGFNDIGLVTAPDGRSYAVAILIGDTARPVRERQQLMQTVISTIVATHGN